MDIGDKFRIQATDYTIVGLFDAGGKAFESEIWVDVNSLGSTTKRESYSSVLLRVKDQAALDELAKRISDDQRLQLKAVPERKFYEDQQGAASGVLKGLGVFVAFIMAVGAGFAGMNTMYAAVARRTKEIGTLARARLRPPQHPRRVRARIGRDRGGRRRHRHRAGIAAEFRLDRHVEIS